MAAYATKQTPNPRIILPEETVAGPLKLAERAGRLREAAQGSADVLRAVYHLAQRTIHARVRFGGIA